MAEDIPLHLIIGKIEAVSVEEEVVLFDRNETFIIDSGCTSHMTVQLLSELEYRCVTVANGEELPIVAVDLSRMFFLFRDWQGTSFQCHNWMRKGSKKEKYYTGLVENIGVKKGRFYEFAGAVSERRAELTLWHKRLAHINERDLSEMISGDAVKGIAVRSNQNCFCKA
jgi:hypothetical protein